MTRPVLKAVNAYGGIIATVEPLSHARSLTWSRVTYVFDGQTYVANTLPGASVNWTAQTWPEGLPARIILNGRRQIIFIDAMEPDESEEA